MGHAGGVHPTAQSYRSRWLVSPMLLLALTRRVAGVVPRYTATRPNYEEANGGLPLLPGAVHVTPFTASPDTGTYNHQPMIEWWVDTWPAVHRSALPTPIRRFERGR